MFPVHVIAGHHIPVHVMTAVMLMSIANSHVGHIRLADSKTRNTSKCSSHSHRTGKNQTDVNKKNFEGVY